MKSKIFALCIALAFSLSAPRISAKSEIKKLERKISWPEFMERQAMTWEVIPEVWYDSPFMGNGNLGLIINRESGTNSLRFTTGCCEVHDHRPGGGLLNNPRLHTGEFRLNTIGNITGGSMKLDIWNGETTAEISTDRGKIFLTAFVHADDMVSAIRIKCEGDERASVLKWISPDPQSPRYIHSKTPAGAWIDTGDYRLNPKPTVKGTIDCGSCNGTLLAGGATSAAWRTQSVSNDERVLWWSIAHSYPDTLSAQKTARLAVEKAVAKGFDNMRRTNNEWWNAYYPVSFLTLPDAKMENFYWAQLYKLAAATRGDRALIDTCGPWLQNTPWPNSWWNLNVQLTYWPLNASNHLDLAESLENALYDNIETLHNNIPEQYRGATAAIGRSANLKAESSTVGVPGQTDVLPEIGNLLWACHNLWLIYRHKMDDELLRDKLYPLMTEAVNYYLLFLEEGNDGRLHLPTTYSPEYDLAPDCNYDLQLLRWGCMTLRYAAKRLGDNPPLEARWADVCNRLAYYPTDSTGLMIGRGVPFSKPHRHYSHMLAAYPLYTLNIEQPGSENLISKSLAHWQSLPGAMQGYSFTGASSISSALRRGNDALKYLKGLFGKFLKPSTLYTESGPVIETPLSGAQSIHDMLLQSWGEKLRIFPAVPDEWRDVTFDNWLAEGGFTVSAKRTGGKTDFISITSRAGEPCIVMTDIPSPVATVNQRSTKIDSIAENTYSIPISKGETVLITPKSSALTTLVIKPINNGPGHSFGKKR